MSDGFAGSATKKFQDPIKEIETRLKKLGIFEDDFDGKNSFRQTTPEQDTSKAQGPFAESGSRGMSAAGDAREQAPLDRIDREQQHIEGGIKPATTQFPGAKMNKAPEGEKRETFAEKVASRLKRLANKGKVVAQKRVQGVLIEVIEQPNKRYSVIVDGKWVNENISSASEAMNDGIDWLNDDEN